MLCETRICFQWEASLLERERRVREGRRGGGRQERLIIYERQGSANLRDLDMPALNSTIFVES